MELQGFSVGLYVPLLESNLLAPSKAALLGCNSQFRSFRGEQRQRSENSVSLSLFVLPSRMLARSKAASFISALVRAGLLPTPSKKGSLVLVMVIEASTA